MEEKNQSNNETFEMPFEDAYEYLQQLVKQLESDMLPLDQLANKVSEARKVAEQCEQQLRNVEDAMNSQATDIASE